MAVHEPIMMQRGSSAWGSRSTLNSMSDNNSDRTPPPRVTPPFHRQLLKRVDERLQNSVALHVKCYNQFHNKRVPIWDYYQLHSCYLWRFHHFVPPICQSLHWSQCRKHTITISKSSSWYDVLNWRFLIALFAQNSAIKSPTLSITVSLAFSAHRQWSSL